MLSKTLPWTRNHLSPTNRRQVINIIIPPFINNVQHQPWNLTLFSSPQSCHDIVINHIMHHKSSHQFGHVIFCIQSLTLPMPPMEKDADLNMKYIEASFPNYNQIMFQSLAAYTLGSPSAEPLSKIKAWPVREKPSLSFLLRTTMMTVGRLWMYLMPITV